MECWCAAFCASVPSLRISPGRSSSGAAAFLRTAYTLITLRGALGWSLFAVVWGAAIVGVVLNAIDVQKYSRISMVCYVAMGWVVVLAIRPLMASLAWNGLVLLALGGVFYTVGIVFYVIRRSYMHSIWHLFVLAGSVCHYLSILLYVIPTTF